MEEVESLNLTSYKERFEGMFEPFPCSPGPIHVGNIIPGDIHGKLKERVELNHGLIEESADHYFPQKTDPFSRFHTMKCLSIKIKMSLSCIKPEKCYS